MDARKLRWVGMSAALAVLGIGIVAGIARGRMGAGAAALPSAHVRREGVDVEFQMEGAGGVAGAREGDSLLLRFRVTDAVTGEPLRGRGVAAWMDAGSPSSRDEGAACREKVPLYLRGLVGVRPLIDLNSYFVVVMNQDASLSIVDPIVGMTGKTNLYATIILPRPGADWATSADGRRLYVSMPEARQVAIVDLERFELVGAVEVGANPTRVAIQPDGRLVWVGNDADGPRQSGVTAFDPESREVVASIPTGRGHHELAFSADDRRVFVTNRGDGTVSVIDVVALAKRRDVQVGGAPLAAATSALSGAVYVTDGEGGRISVLDPDEGEILTRLELRPGIGPLGFTQDGRWGFVLNPYEHRVDVVDASTNRIAHGIPMGGEPYQVAFTRTFAYVRLLDSARVSMVRLETLGGTGAPVVHGFDVGTRPPRSIPDLSLASAISAAVTDAGVFVASPGDNAIYFYMEGMNAPMGSHGGYGHAIRAVTLADRSVKETAPGEYVGSVRVPTAGRYDVAFLLDAPRLIHCFGFDAEPNPTIRRSAGAVGIEYLDLPNRIPVHARSPVRFKLLEPSTGKPLDGLRDVTVVSWMLPASPAVRTAATETEPGTYEASPAYDHPGTYYLHVEIPSKGVSPGMLRYRGIRVVDAALGSLEARKTNPNRSEGARR